MINLLYVLAAIYIIAWAIGVFVMHAGGIMHFALLPAILLILLRVIQKKPDNHKHSNRPDASSEAHWS